MTAETGETIHEAFAERKPVGERSFSAEAAEKRGCKGDGGLYREEKREYHKRFGKCGDGGRRSGGISRAFLSLQRTALHSALSGASEDCAPSPHTEHFSLASFSMPDLSFSREALISSSSAWSLPEILRYGIGNVGLIEIGFGDAFTVAAHYSCGNAHRGRVCGDIAENHGSRGDFGIVADREIAEKLRTRADHYVISERRMAFSGFLPCTAESHSLVYRAVVADYRGARRSRLPEPWSMKSPLP